MPHLGCEQNIQDFIACIALAVLKGFMYDSEVSKLLYAAQVATGALLRQSPARRSEPKPAASSAPRPPAAEPVRELSQEASREANAA